MLNKVTMDNDTDKEFDEVYKQALWQKLN